MLQQHLDYNIQKDIILRHLLKKKFKQGFNFSNITQLDITIPIKKLSSNDDKYNQLVTFFFFLQLFFLKKLCLKLYYSNSKKRKKLHFKNITSFFITLRKENLNIFLIFFIFFIYPSIYLDNSKKMLFHFKKTKDLNLKKKISLKFPFINYFKQQVNEDILLQYGLNNLYSWVFHFYFNTLERSIQTFLLQNLFFNLEIKKKIKF